MDKKTITLLVIPIIIGIGLAGRTIWNMGSEKRRINKLLRKVR
jgi:hypothetical protein